jgi:hypothetical protein
MAYDEPLAHRVRVMVAKEAGITEKRMFGGLAFLCDGHMAVVIRGKGGLMVRLAPAAAPSAVLEPGVTEDVMRDRIMTGWVVIEPSVVDKSADLRRWVKRGLTAARSVVL